MKDCAVSVASPPDGQAHTVEVAASSLFDAAAQAITGGHGFGGGMPI